MKVVAFSTLIYGMDFIRESIRSVYDAVDEFWFLWTPRPSFGFDTDAVNPDHAADLLDATKDAAGVKWHWYSGSPNQWRSEGEHHDFIYTLVNDADTYVRLDVDELYQDGLLASAVEYARREDVSAVRLPMIHYWRSFYKAMTNDPAYPVRINRPHAANKRDVTYREAGAIHHLGYAQRSEVVRYKQDISAHRNEWRRDWYETRWVPNAQKDVHPVIHDWWNPESVDPYALGLPLWMKEHQYSELELIP